MIYLKIVFSYWIFNVIFFYFIIYCYVWYNYLDFFLFLYDRGWMDGRFVLEYILYSFLVLGNIDWIVCGIFSGVGVFWLVLIWLGEKKWRCLRFLLVFWDFWGVSFVVRIWWIVCVDGMMFIFFYLVLLVDIIIVFWGILLLIWGLLCISLSILSILVIILSNIGIVF